MSQIATVPQSIEVLIDPNRGWNHNYDVKGPFVRIDDPILFPNRVTLRASTRSVGDYSQLRMRIKAHFGFVPASTGQLAAEATFATAGAYLTAGSSLMRALLRAYSSVGVFDSAGNRRLYHKYPTRTIGSLVDENASTDFITATDTGGPVADPDIAIGGAVDFTVNPSQSVGVTAVYMLDAMAQADSLFQINLSTGARGLYFPQASITIG